MNGDASAENLAAGCGPRLAAFVTDFCLLLLILLLVLLLLSIPHYVLSVTYPVVVLGLISLVPAPYFIVWQCLSWMATPGKKDRGLIVVTREGRRMGFWRAVVRYLVLAVSMILVLPLLVIFFNRRRRGLHDMIAGTQVVDAKTFKQGSFSLEHVGKPVSERWLLMILSAIAFPLFAFSSGFFLTLGFLVVVAPDRAEMGSSSNSGECCPDFE